MVTRTTIAFIYSRDGSLLLVCPPSDTVRWWSAKCVLRVEVRDIAPTPPR